MHTNNYCGRRVDNLEWVYGSYLQVGDRCYIITTTGDKDHELYNVSTPLFLYEVEPETVSPFIGITDTYGIDLYLNDIVETKYGRQCVITRKVSPSYCGYDLEPLEANHKKPDQYDLWHPGNLLFTGYCLLNGEKKERFY